MSGRIDPERNLICEFPGVPRKQRVSQKRRAAVDPRPALCGPNDYPAARQTTKSIQRYEGGRHEKSPPDSIRTRYVFSHIRAHIHVRASVHSRSRPPRNAHVDRANARGTSYTIPSTDWRDGTLHPRHAHRATGCPARSAADCRVQAAIGRLQSICVWSRLRKMLFES